MPLSDDARRRFCRCIEEMRRGKIASNAMAADLLARLETAGLEVAEAEPEPDLEAMAAALTEAGYQVVPPDGE